MKPLDQVCSTDAYAPDHTAKVHKQFPTQGTVSWKNLEHICLIRAGFPQIDKTQFPSLSLNDIIMLMILDVWPDASDEPRY